jgi:outer membrane protein assembly factor BamA
VIVGVGVTPAPAGAGVTYRGTSLWTARELDGFLGLSPGIHLSAEELASRLPGLLDRYVEAGFVDAVLRLYASGDDVLLEIDPGRRVLVGDRRLDGVPGELSEEVADVFSGGGGTPLRGAATERELRRATELLAERGYPYATAEATDFVRDRDRIHYRIRIESGDRLEIDSLRVRGLGLTRQGTVEQIARFTPGGGFRQSDLSAIRGRLARSGLFRRVGDVRLGLVSGGTRGAYEVDVDEAPSAAVHGLIGVGGIDRTLTGLLDVEIPNLFGTARSFGVRWEGRGKGRQLFRIGYREPWILRAPVAVSGEFEQEQEGDIFTRTIWLADLEYSPIDRLSLLVGWQSEESVVPEGDLQRSTRSGSRIGLKWEGRDDPLDPRRGGRIRLQGTQGTQEERFRGGGTVERDVTTLESHFESLFVVREGWGIALALAGHLRDAPGEAPRPETLYPIGGATSLRGYEERRFRSGRAAVLTLEGRRHLRGDGSRVHVFVDAAYLDPARTLGTGGDAWKVGGGVGLRVASRAGLLGVDLAASDEVSSTDELRIHVSVEGRY